ncbi:exonuclease domain-containing protein [Rhabdobacter roseus]|uniref:DNA polymerase-3 subunit epsilon n=1 Tax=Rhabdobacter roseus TaxID=1655419 RepID=A0A840TLH5_9BACT|nr:exonuclease domain-containing protein [Rhabdobacter roseus]MBB5284411.1 DNA polymerase-3 subunit epsilon [Rhabdobacter roseus]
MAKIDKKTKYLVLDTETTGVTPEDEALSIAIVDQDGQVILDTYIRPERHTEWPKAMETNGITPEFIFQGTFPTMADLTPVLEVLLQGQRVVMYGADFDTRFLPISSLEGSEVICCMNRFSEYMGVPDPKRPGEWKRHKLILAAEHVRYEWIGTPHGALADALATLAVWRFLELNDTADPETVVI